jgi:hypothetical protein
MSLLKRLNEITKPKVHEAQADLGFGDGEEKIFFRSLSFEERQKIFGARANAEGVLDTREKGLFLVAEFIAASLCDENGKNVVTLENVKRWDSDFIDKLGQIGMDTLNKAAEEAKQKSDPSAGQS